MNAVLIRRLAASATLAALMLAVVAAPGYSDDKSDIENLEKQLTELKKKLDDVKAKAAASPTTVAPGLPESVLKQTAFRNIGPANMGGRVTALAVYEPDSTIFYVATASGGLLKTVNNGITFTHQFDQQATVSIGDVAVCQSNSDLVWIGTGEANPRNSVSYGDGVYKSTDGGKTWNNMGLKNSFSIGKVLIHPKNPDVVYVGSLGRLYGPGGDRGVFMTSDGGKTWQNSLSINDKTGIIDMAMDPTDPNIIIAAGWERKRDEFDGFFGEAPVPDSYGPIVTHGAGGGLWKTVDGGKTWKKINDAKLRNGLPTVKTGRIGLSYSAKTKGLVYAIIDTEKVGTGEALKQVYMGIVGETEGTNGGAKLTEITADGPASKAGLKPGDIVIKAESNAVTGYDDLVAVIQTKMPENKLKLVVKREGKDVDIEVTLAQRPQTGGGRQGGGGGAGGGGRTGGGRPGGAGQAPARPVMGFRMAAADSLKIGAVTADSPAEKAGVKEGDEIVALDGKPVKTFVEYLAVMGNERKAGDKVKLTVKRGTETKDLEVTLIAPATPATGIGGGTTPGGILMPGFMPDFQNRELLKVGTVQKDGPAEKAGIKVGDEIVEIDGKPVTGMREMTTALRTSQREDNPRKAGDKVKVKLKQGEKFIEAELPLVEMAGPNLGGAGGPNRGPNAAKPYLLGLGGQQPNMGDQQGKDGYQTGGVYLSKDAGETWTRVNSFNPRPMYYCVIRVDPTNDDNVFVIGDTPALYWSKNGGKTFRSAPTRGVHPDGHAFWIDPKNNKHWVLGCDGGFYTTYDNGEHWEHFNQFALGQFYHVAVDNRKPYRVYGGLQDNGSWGGPSRTLRSYGPVNEDFINVGGGDGFVCRVDPNDPDLIYSESQGGMISRRNFRTGDRGFIRPGSTGGRGGRGGAGGAATATPPPMGETAPTQPQAAGAESPPRFNWNTPFILSSHNSSIFYSASEFVWKSVKKGAELKKLSPEITRSKAGSGTALSESPISGDTLYAGTDDGYVWVTKDGGTTWTNITENIKKAGLPGYRCVATLEASKDAPGRCYACFDAHRSDDDKPYVFMTTDYGQTWKSIVGNLPAFGSTRCLREDIVNADVLYCGTEFGLFVSIDRGVTWNKFQNLPTVAVHEIAQPTSMSEIVVATHGRSLWIAEVTSLRQMSSKTFTAKATLFTPAPAVRWRTASGSESPYSVTAKKYVGQNPPNGAAFEYYLSKTSPNATLKLLDVNGKTVASFDRMEKSAGYHRVQWNLQAGTGLAKTGTYRLVLNVDGEEQSQAVSVELDPNAPKDVLAIDAEEEAPMAPVNPNKPVKVPLIKDN